MAAGITKAADDLSSKKNSRKKLTMVSLFSGCGGLDLGFEQAGFECVFASDIMPAAEETYKINFPNTTFVRKDIRLLTNDEIKKLIGNKHVDVIVGGPPCQGFSNMGNKNSADPRNYLFEDYVRIVDLIKPRCFLFENVKGFFTMIIPSPIWTIGSDEPIVGVPEDAKISKEDFEYCYDFIIESSLKLQEFDFVSSIEREEGIEKWLK